MIEYQNVSKEYQRGVQALKNIHFKVRKGEMAFVTGHSGAGKSTLLRLLMLIEKPTMGVIKVGETVWNDVPKSKIAFYRRQIGMVHQNNLLINRRTVFENVALPMEISGCSKADIEKRVNAALSKVNLYNKRHHYPNMISLGEQQRVGIARAVVNRPLILIADEPTGNLDPNLSQKVMDLFFDFADAGVTVLIASHDRNLISRYKQRTIILNEGQILYDTQADRGFS